MAEALATTSTRLVRKSGVRRFVQALTPEGGSRSQASSGQAFFLATAALHTRHADVAVVRFSADQTTGKTAPGGANAGRSNRSYCGRVPRPRAR